MPVDWFVVICPPIIALLLIVGVMSGVGNRKVMTAGGLLLCFYLIIYFGGGVYYGALAQVGNSNAQYELSCWYIDRLGHNWPDLESSDRWLIVAAENGSPRAMYELAKRYKYGRHGGIERDHEKAKYWFGRAKVHGLGDRDEELKGLDQ